jgi:hypothetical protein
MVFLLKKKVMNILIFLKQGISLPSEQLSTAKSDYAPWTFRPNLVVAETIY